MFHSLLFRRTTSLPFRQMASVHTMTSPFTQAVVNSMRKLYPEVLADKSFDNTGLLLEAPFDPSQRRANSVLLTIDLTKAVAEEAIANNHSVVVAYHPIIFRGLKSLTLADSQQSTLLRLATQGIGVYSPHTAVDAIPGGMADWLCDIVTGNLDATELETHTNGADANDSPESETDVRTSENTSAASTKPDSPLNTAHTDDPFISPKSQSKEGTASLTSTQRTYSKPAYPTATPVSNTSLHPTIISHTRTVINPSPPPSLSAANASAQSSSRYTAQNTGAGRLISFTTPQPLADLIKRIARGLGSPSLKGFAVATPQSTTVEDHKAIRSVAVCPGSGSSVLRSVFGSADLIFTGELSHHEALAVTEQGGCVVSLFHSNSERGYLWSVMKSKLERALEEEWRTVREEMVAKAAHKGRAGEDLAAVLNDESVRVEVSKQDRDPYGIVILGGE
jgi:dinuclear metal center YbgI/SA1388 family protein